MWTNALVPLFGFIRLIFFTHKYNEPARVLFRQKQNFFDGESCDYSYFSLSLSNLMQAVHNAFYGSSIGAPSDTDSLTSFGPAGLGSDLFSLDKVSKSKPLVSGRRKVLNRPKNTMGKMYQQSGRGAEREENQREKRERQRDNERQGERETH